MQALVAQRIEHLTTDQKVGGSIPSERTEQVLVSVHARCCSTCCPAGSCSSLAHLPFDRVCGTRRDAAGKKRQQWVGGFRTRRDAEEALAHVVERVRTGMWSDPGRITVEEYLRTWLDGIRPSLRPSTASSYEQTLRGWVIPRVGSMRLSELTAPRLRALYAELLQSGRRSQWSRGTCPQDAGQAEKARRWPVHGVVASDDR